MLVYNNTKCEVLATAQKSRASFAVTSEFRARLRGEEQSLVVCRVLLVEFQWCSTYYNVCIIPLTMYF